MIELFCLLEQVSACLPVHPLPFLPMKVSSLMISSIDAAGGASE